MLSVIYIKTGNAIYSAAAHSLTKHMLISFDLLSYAGFKPYDFENGYYLFDPTVLVIAAALAIISVIYLKRSNAECKQ